MARKVLLATDKPFAKVARDEVVAILKKAGYDVPLLEGYKSKSDLLAAVADVDAMIIRSDVVDAEVLEAAKSLKLVVRAGAGYDNIDCMTARAKGVDAMNTPGQNSNAVAELAIAMMIYMARGKFNGKSGTEIKGKRLGVHAIGAVGRLVANIARSGFGMSIKAFDVIPADQIKAAGAEPVGAIEDLYSGCDYISLHIPATAQTKKSIGFRLLNLMPKGGTLINTARKEVIDEPGLLEMLEKRPDFKYATDVEPDAETAAVIKEKYADRVYWTPKKMGAQTEEANVNAGIAAANQIVAYFEQGVKQFIVNP